MLGQKQHDNKIYIEMAEDHWLINLIRYSFAGRLFLAGVLVMYMILRNTPAAWLAVFFSILFLTQILKIDMSLSTRAGQSSLVSIRPLAVGSLFSLAVASVFALGAGIVAPKPESFPILGGFIAFLVAFAVTRSVQLLIERR